MGALRNALQLMSGATPADTTQLQAERLTRPNPQILSPWTPQTGLSTIVWADIFSEAGMPITRTVAMSIPAIAKGRHVVAPKIGATPLRVLKHDAETQTDAQVPDPGWINSPDPTCPVPPFHRMTWTVDDLIFTGWSLWSRVDLATGFPQYVSRVPRDDWQFDAEGFVTIQGEQVSSERVILIPGPHEGILNFGRTAILHARQLLAAAARAGDVPNPNVELHYTGDDELSDAEITELLRYYVAARQGENGGVSFTNSVIESKYGPSMDAQLLIDGRNAAAVDMARLIGIAAAMVDATAPKASLNYETTQGRGLEHTEYGVEPYMQAIEARLSLDDVVPRGSRVRFDIEQDLGPVQPTGPVVED